MRAPYPVPNNLPQYKSHKVVAAAKILKISSYGHGALLTCVSQRPDEDAVSYEFDVDMAYLQKHKPEIDGYFVLYEDGYQSFSPAKAFEEGYTRIN